MAGFGLGVGDGLGLGLGDGLGLGEGLGSWLGDGLVLGEGVGLLPGLGLVLGEGLGLLPGLGLALGEVPGVWLGDGLPLGEGLVLGDDGLSLDDRLLLRPDLGDTWPDAEADRVADRESARTVAGRALHGDFGLCGETSWAAANAMPNVLLQHNTAVPASVLSTSKPARRLTGMAAPGRASLAGLVSSP